MISEEDKVRTRHHLGFLGVQSVSTFVLGVPAGVQTQFMIEGAWDRVLPSHESKFRQLLDRCDAIEQQIEDNTENLAAKKVDEIELNELEFKELMTRYKYWQAALGNLLGVAPNPYDQRFSSWTGSGGINVSVRHG